MKISGAEIICESLLREGVNVIFGHPGGAILPLYDALYGYDQIRHILVRHEQCAAHAADGYARASGKVGVCIATSGPGATNLVTGIMSAKADSVPLVAITGQVARSGMGTEAFQECDTIAITASCTKRNYLVMDIDDLAPTIFEAFRVAQEGRPGPTLIDIPKDIQQELTEFIYPTTHTSSATLLPETIENLQSAADLINNAEKPLIIAGHGVIVSQAWSVLQSLVEKTDIPIINTLLGLSSFPRNHPLSLGMLGMHGMYWSNIAVDQCDLILGLGMRFDDRITGKPGTFAPSAKIIHVDIETSQIGKNVPTHVGLIGDVNMVLNNLLPMVNKSNRTSWRKQIDALRNEHRSLDIPQSNNLLAQHVLQDLNDLIQDDDDPIAVTGVGQHQMWAAQYLFFNNPNAFISSGGLGAMGFEIPAAMGAQVARPNASVWSIAGDGGFQMTLQELATIVQENLPVKIAIFNNGHLGMVRQWQELFYDERYKSVPVPGPDFVKLAEAYGIPGLRITKREDVKRALVKAQNHPGPFLIDFVIEHQSNVYPMVPVGASLSETVEDPRTIIEAQP